MVLKRTMQVMAGGLAVGFIAAGAHHMVPVTPNTIPLVKLPAHVTKSVVCTPKTVTVQSGQSLSGIAAANHTTVTAIVQASSKITNPNSVKVGQVVTVKACPPTAKGGALPKIHHHGGRATILRRMARHYVSGHIRHLFRG